MPHDQIQKLTIMNIPLKKNQIHLDLLAILICCLQNGWQLDTPKSCEHTSAHGKIKCHSQRSRLQFGYTWGENHFSKLQNTGYLDK